MRSYPWVPALTCIESRKTILNHVGYKKNVQRYVITIGKIKKMTLKQLQDDLNYCSFAWNFC